MKSTSTARVVALLSVVMATVAFVACNKDKDSPSDPSGGGNGPLVEEGREVFRYETFGDEWFWTGVLQMNAVVATLSPEAALGLGLKVDVDALPDAVKAGITDGDPSTVPLDDPATTMALLGLDAVIGVKAMVENGQITDLGITCALCHSTVDNSFSAGIGHRLDGWPNRNLQVGAIIAASPAVEGATEATYASWPAGFYDPRFNFDGQSKPTVIPPAYGLQGVPFITFTGDGEEVKYWNRYVGVTQMHGQGTFSDSRLPFNSTTDYTGEGNDGNANLVEPKLDALQAYQLSLAAPQPPAGSYDAQAAQQGEIVFNGQGTCSTCHDPEHHFTLDHLLDPGASMVEPETPSYAARSATGKYRPTPLRGAWQHPSYFHDGSAPTLADVVNTYDTKLNLGLSSQQKLDLVEYLKSL